MNNDKMMMPINMLLMDHGHDSLVTKHHRICPYLHDEESPSEMNQLPPEADESLTHPDDEREGLELLSNGRGRARTSALGPHNWSPLPAEIERQQRLKLQSQIIHQILMGPLPELLFDHLLNKVHDSRSGQQDLMRLTQALLSNIERNLRLYPEESLDQLLWKNADHLKQETNAGTYVLSENWKQAKSYTGKFVKPAFRPIDDLTMLAILACRLRLSNPHQVQRWMVIRDHFDMIYDPDWRETQNNGSSINEVNFVITQLVVILVQKKLK